MFPTRLVLTALLAIAAVSALAALVTLVERRYRRIRDLVLAREPEHEVAHAARPSPIADLVRERGLDPGDGRSAHRLLPDGPEALAVRLALVDAVARTLDLQYYTWHDDLAGRVLARRTLAAAERGVRCRVLLDDLHASGTRALVETLAAHPLVTVRVFNPSLTRRAYFLHWLVDFRRLNRRMHNKALVADAALGIVGGRNVGDAYFGLSTRMNFRDCDALVAGPVARELGASVSRYWNGEFAFPCAAFGVEEHAGGEALARRLVALDAAIAETLARESVPDAAGGPDEAAGELGATRAGAARRPSLADAVGRTTLGRSRLIDDPPDAPRTGATAVAEQIRHAFEGARSALDIEAGYLVPGRDGVRRLGGLARSGVRVRATTNSFATNDVLAAQAGYASHRRALLAAGVELHELRPDAPVRRVRSLLSNALGRGARGRDRADGPAVAALHAKVLAIDGRTAYIGSFNLDPRSALDNSEVVVEIEGEAFAAEVQAFLERGRDPTTSYRVELVGRRVRWHDGRTAREREPGLTWPARALALGVRVLPVERLL